jgi:signal transduction histidine kinase
MTTNAYVLIGLTIIVGSLAAMLAFAVLRLVEAARQPRRHGRGGNADNPMLSAALEEAVARLQARERATAARAEASERLSDQIMASLTAGLLVVGLDGSVRILNPAARRMLTVPDVAPLKDFRVLLGEPALSDLIDECLITRTAILRRSIRLPQARGGTSHLGVTVSPLSDVEGELHGAICLFTDLTAVKLLEEQLRLKESLAAVGELTAGIAHEFRNGLATIHGYGKLLDLKTIPENYRPYVEGIQAETQSLAEMVTNFLNFAKPAQLTLSRVPLRVVCERAADDVRAEAKNLGGEVTMRGEFGDVEGDEVLLRQAFSNLLRNAVEACAGASRVPIVSIDAELDPQQHTSIVTIDDSGPGIPPEARERVFQPFFTTKRSGTGLGLALVQKIIVFHNGRVTVSASALGGASLRVTLPTL